MQRTLQNLRRSFWVALGAAEAVGREAAEEGGGRREAFGRLADVVALGCRRCGWGRYGPRWRGWRRDGRGRRLVDVELRRSEHQCELARTLGGRRRDSPWRLGWLGGNGCSGWRGRSSGGYGRRGIYGRRFQRRIRLCGIALWRIDLWRIGPWRITPRQIRPWRITVWQVRPRRSSVPDQDRLAQCGSKKPGEFVVDPLGSRGNR